jgi:hypothetical protein
MEAVVEASTRTMRWPVLLFPAQGVIGPSPASRFHQATRRAYWPGGWPTCRLNAVLNVLAEP